MFSGNRAGVDTEEEDDHLYGYDAEYGNGADVTLGGMARNVSVAPHDTSSSLRYLEFEL